MNGVVAAEEEDEAGDGSEGVPVPRVITMVVVVWAGPTDVAELKI